MDLIGQTKTKTVVLIADVGLLDRAALHGRLEQALAAHAGVRFERIDVRYDFKRHRVLVHERPPLRASTGANLRDMKTRLFSAIEEARSYEERRRKQAEQAFASLEVVYEFARVNNLEHYMGRPYYRLMEALEGRDIDQGQVHHPEDKR